MSSLLSAPPLLTPLVEPPQAGERPSWMITRVWEQWFRSVTQRVQTAAYQAFTTTLTAQDASIALTTLVPAAVTALYRITWTARITTPGTVSSSLEVSVVTTDGGVVITQTGTALTGNTTATVGTGPWMVRCDPATPISYTTTYASAGATAMLYALDMVVEAL
jgi:hypothetical protein